MATISEKEVPEGQLIDLTKLSLQQLLVLRQQLDRELISFKESGSTLNMVQQKFQFSYDSLKSLQESDVGKESLIPLTQSLYAIGHLKDVNNVLIDIGTGYYVNKTREESKDYFKRKVEFLGEKLQTLKAICVEKQRIRATIDEVLELKVKSAANASNQSKSN